MILQFNFSPNIETGFQEKVNEERNNPFLDDVVFLFKNREEKVRECSSVSHNFQHEKIVICV